MEHWGQTSATYVYNHCNKCNILIYFCNICVKHLKYTSKTFESTKMYTWNMHHIPVRPPSPSTSGRHNRSSRRGRMTFAPRPDASPCAGGAWWRRRVRRAAEQEQQQEERVHGAVAGVAATGARSSCRSSGTGAREQRQEERGVRQSGRWTCDELTGY
jgi:hypothetical protein